MPVFVRKRRVRVHLKDENRSLEGIWVGMAAGHYRIAAVQQLEDHDRSYPVDGEAWVPRDRVLYLQVLG